MKTLRDTNNNNSSAAQSNFSSTGTRQHAAVVDVSPEYDSSAGSCPTSHLPQQTNWRSNTDQSVASSPKLSTPSNNVKLHPPQPPLNPLATGFNGDANLFSSLIESYLSKLGGNHILQTDPVHPLLCLQYINANTMLTQPLAAMQNSTSAIASDPMKYLPHSAALEKQQTLLSSADLSGNPASTGSASRALQANSNVFVPKTRPMTHDEIAEHAHLVYQRALQRNQPQQNNDLIKHFYDTLNTKSISHHEVPTVPNVSHIASIGTFDVVDTVITSPSSCYSPRESGIDAALSSVSLLSADETKMPSNAGSVLDPAAPVFIPRHSRSKLDDDIETSSSSSDSDFNDFHYLDQFLDDFYNTDNNRDNHLIVRKRASTETVTAKCAAKHNALGQGDASDDPSPQSVSATVQNQDCQYSVYDLLDRYRNPRCHLVLPEWSRLSLILPNVCSMRAHTYKIKRYFAFRRRLHEDQNGHKQSNNAIPMPV